MPKNLVEDLNDEIIAGPGYTFKRSELSAAFDNVASTTHWKDPIHALIATEDLHITTVAVEFYTATKLKVEASLHNGRFLRVSAVGYRNGPAGP